MAEKQAKYFNAINTETGEIIKLKLLDETALHSDKLADNLVTTEDGFALDAKQGKALADKLLCQGAGAHNSHYRGKFLGSAPTAEQYAQIAAGTFDDLYIGDYWTIGDIIYRIAAFDYFYNTGDTKCIEHHAVMVPDESMGSAQMNTSNVTTGGYVGSAMYTANLSAAKAKIKAAFSGHVLKHRIYLVNKVANGAPSGAAWSDSEVDLMNEKMVYGCPVFTPMSDGTKNVWNAMHNYTVEKSQLPLFAFNPSVLNTGYDYWLRDVTSDANFAMVGDCGYSDSFSASGTKAIRPYFCIG